MLSLDEVRATINLTPFEEWKIAVAKVTGKDVEELGRPLTEEEDDQIEKEIEKIRQDAHESKIRIKSKEEAKRAELEKQQRLAEKAAAEIAAKEAADAERRRPVATRILERVGSELKLRTEEAKMKAKKAETIVIVPPTVVADVSDALASIEKELAALKQDKQEVASLKTSKPVIMRQSSFNKMMPAITAKEEQPKKAKPQSRLW